MNVVETKLPGVVVLEPKVFGDERGFFMESYTKRVLAGALGVDYEIVQENHSLSTKAGTLRGLHYQLEPMAQAKIVRVVAGAVLDVAVDIRRGSPTFAQWVGVELSAENKRQLVVPRGFAHGICTLVPDTEILYRTDNYYSPEHDRGIAWDDPELGIEWPVDDPVLSEKDRRHPPLGRAEMTFVYRPDR